MAGRNRSRTRRVVLVVVLAVVLGLIVRIATWRNPGVIISPETTYITSPLREDGTVDYAAAMNERSSQGVTPDNNAVVLLLQATGPEDLAAEIRERFFQLLGIDPLPEKGPYLERYDSYFERKSVAAGGSTVGPTGDVDVREEAGKERERIASRPWTKANSPIAAAWLDENRRSIDLVVAATGRPRFYAPLVVSLDEGTSLGFWSLHWVWDLEGSAGYALCSRAMLRIGEGKPKEAWQDLLACHWLARLIDQGPTLLEGVIAIRIEEMAVERDAVLAHEGKLTAEQARRFAADLRKLPPMTKMAYRFNWGIRLEHLNYVVATSRGGVDGDALLQDVFGKKPISFVQRIDIAWTDWNEPMRIGNRCYDRLAAAMSKPTRRERLAALADAQRELQPVLDRVRGDVSTFRKILSLGGLLGKVRRWMAAIVIRGPNQAYGEWDEMNAEDRAAVKRDMALLVFALAAYRADHGAYPADLTALVPKYVPTLPEDIFSSGPLRYRREGDGYVLYSVGPNGRDDGGRHYPDDPDLPVADDWDDIVLRVPAKVK